MTLNIWEGPSGVVPREIKTMLPGCVLILSFDMENWSKSNTLYILEVHIKSCPRIERKSRHSAEQIMTLAVCPPQLFHARELLATQISGCMKHSILIWLWQGKQSRQLHFAPPSEIFNNAIELWLQIKHSSAALFPSLIPPSFDQNSPLFFFLTCLPLSPRTFPQTFFWCAVQPLHIHHNLEI